MNRKITSILLALCMVLTCAAVGSFSALAGTADSSVSANAGSDSAANAYGLASKIEDGNILHCFDWKYSDIKAELKNIAQAGFTSIQTSPAQEPDSWGAWYWLYQPKGFYISSSPLGTKSELQSLCTEAHKYGIKVLVDIVSNHLTGDRGKVQSDLQAGQYWHPEFEIKNWTNPSRYELINGKIGMADLNTSNSYVQQVVKNYLNTLKGIGVDGFRFDAAKHIGLPSEGDNYWKMVQSMGMYVYGEILDQPGGDAKKIINEYANYIGVTDIPYSGNITGSIRDGAVKPTTGKFWNDLGVPASKIVYFGESHDTFANKTPEQGEGGWTKYLQQNFIDRAYAVVGARADSQSLYLSRPGTTDKENIRAGVKGSTHFTAKEVAAVNHFHNAMIGSPDKVTTANNCYMVSRNRGAVIVAAKGSNLTVSMPNPDGMVMPGTYNDEVSGTQWTVTSSTVSGKIGSMGIAVIYNGNPVATTAPTTVKPTTKPTTAPQPTTAPMEQVLIGDSNNDGDVTIGDATKIQMHVARLKMLTGKNMKAADVNVDGDISIKDATMIQYYLSRQFSKSGSCGKTIGQAATQQPTTRPATQPATTAVVQPTTVSSSIKVDPTKVYFKNNDNWSPVKAYFWSDSNTQMMSWPGNTMQSEGNNIYSAKIPSGATKVIFTKGDDSGKTPDLDVNAGKMYSNGSWTNVEGGSSSSITPTQGGTQADTTKVYFRNSSGWSPVKAYFWSDSNTQMMSWPGNTMQSEGNNVYSAKIPSGATKVIFTKGDDSGKTPDLDVMPGQIYDNGWSSYGG